MSNFREIDNKVSTNNSTIIALDNGENFTGEWEDVSQWNRLVVSPATDQDGYYEIQFSPDGNNIDSTLTRYYRTGQINPPEPFTITRQYARIRFFNNSGSNQTYLRLQVLLGDFPDLNIPVDSVMSQDYSAVSVRPTEYKTEVALGRRQGATTWSKFGYNLALNATTNEVFASFGGAFNQRLASGETLSIVSSDAQDDSTGTGVRQLIIFGVDANWDLVTEVVALDGTSPVTTSNSFLGVNRMTIFTSGSSNSNVGVITATASTSSNVMAEMPAAQGTTQQCIFYVPKNYQFLTTWLYLEANKSSGGGNPVVSWFGKVYSGVVDSEFEVARGRLDTQIKNFIDLKPSEPFVIGEKSILWFEGVSTSNNTELTTGRFSGKLIRDTDA